jgi:hypothetical protein
LVGIYEVFYSPTNMHIQLEGVVVKLSVIVKISKYRGFHEGHHFILMAMEVHDALSMIWIVSSRSVSFAQ